MEVFRADKYNTNFYHSTIAQTGGATGIDQYIYSQHGEGIGSFFGNLLRGVTPIIGKAIKGAVHIAKPHAKRALSDIVTVGAKRALESISGNKPNTKSRKRKAIKILQKKHTHNISRK